MKCPHCQEELGLNNICINPVCSYFSSTIESSENSHLNDDENIASTEIKSSDSLNLNKNINNSNNSYLNEETINRINDKSHNIYDHDNISIDELATFIGSNNTNYYLKYINIMHSNSKFISWNWPSFFLGPYWLLYRKVYDLAFILTALTITFSLVFDSGMPGILLLIVRITLALFANAIYLNVCKRKIKTVKAGIKNLSTTQYIEKLHKKGGVTLVAPLILAGIYIVVVIISIIAFMLFAVTENEPNFSSPYYQY